MDYWGLSRWASHTISNSHPQSSRYITGDQSVQCNPWYRFHWHIIALKPVSLGPSRECLWCTCATFCTWIANASVKILGIQICRDRMWIKLILIVKNIVGTQVGTQLTLYTHTILHHRCLESRSIDPNWCKDNWFKLPPRCWGVCQVVWGARDDVIKSLVNGLSWLISNMSMGVNGILLIEEHHPFFTFIMKFNKQICEFAFLETTMFCNHTVSHGFLVYSTSVNVIVWFLHLKSLYAS